MTPESAKRSKLAQPLLILLLAILLVICFSLLKCRNKWGFVHFLEPCDFSNADGIVQLNHKIEFTVYKTECSGIWQEIE